MRWIAVLSTMAAFLCHNTVQGLAVQQVDSSHVANASSDLPFARVWKVESTTDDGALRHLSARLLSKVIVQWAPQELEKYPNATVAVVLAMSTSPELLSLMEIESNGTDTLSLREKCAEPVDIEAAALVRVYLGRRGMVESVSIHGTQEMILHEGLLSATNPVRLEVSGAARMDAITQAELATKALTLMAHGTGSIDVYSDSIVAEELQTTVRGAGHVTLHARRVSTNTTGIHSSGTGEACMDINGFTTNGLDLSASGASSIKYERAGKCQDGHFQASSTGRINVGMVSCTNVRHYGSGASEAVVRANISLAVIDSGMARVAYVKPDPQAIDVQGNRINNLHSIDGGSFKPPTCRAWKPMDDSPSHISLQHFSTCDSLVLGTRDTLKEGDFLIGGNVQSWDRVWHNLVAHDSIIIPIACVALVSGLFLWYRNHRWAQRRRERMGEGQPLLGVMHSTAVG